MSDEQAAEIAYRKTVEVDLRAALAAMKAQFEAAASERDEARADCETISERSADYRVAMEAYEAELSTVRAQLDAAVLRAGAWETAARHSDELVTKLLAERDTLLDLRDKARELPTDYLLGLVADAVFVQTEDKRRIFWQSVLDEVKAFDAAVDALGDVTPRSEM